jgi:hypothetical protein
MSPRAPSRSPRPVTEFFRSAGTVVATLTATGAQVDGDAVEQLAAGSTAKPHTIHVTGDVTCGTTVSG